MFNYIYNYTDHLGNVRLSYTKDPAINVLTILEENNYYPFGLKHRNYNMGRKQYLKLMDNGGIQITPTNETVYDYKLNGKEYQDELGLNTYAMDMRQYDPAIGRWVVQDSVVHHNYSPHSAFDNNPVMFQS
ncbi:MAG TPA: RHS repeat-associated core domain-containing protein [Flavobacterium sp.]|uniref:RHS repeat-associated core domain-containing protein n=1 Tax=unclassified Flavobacterium TaxID=196869 RepID=UPI0025BE2047|nr:MULTISPECIES: RHS repeat-associated core domain-containing protein [unclassified Flavobacterium]HRE77742.1 RHS repeat-associated core domain-containing protein [Flavobacterium sp.]